MSSIPSNNFIDNRDGEDFINLKEIFNKLSEKWIWFVISVLICLMLAVFYSQYTAPVYQVRAKILVNDDEKGGSLGKQANALMDLGGLMGGKNSVDNEVEILKTRFLMEQVVREMQLNIVYSKKVGIKTREIYTAPFVFKILNGIDTIGETKFYIEKVSNGKVKVRTKDFSKDVSFGEPFKVDNVGTIVLTLSPNLTIDQSTYIVNVNSIDSKVASLMGQLSVGLSNKQVSVIDLGISYPIQKKGEDILNTLIDKYTKANLGDKNAIADSTYQFITERINKIASELGDVENKVENFKQQNQLADMTEQGKLLVQNTGEFSNELAKAETQVTVLSDLEGYLKDQTKSKRVFPSSLIPSDLVFSNLMGQYNSLLLEREKQLLSVTEESPFIQNIDLQIEGLRNDILSNIRTTKDSYITNRDKLRNQLRSAEGRISGVPQIEKNYLKLARNQQIKQELYIFLMQKAEETAISKTSNISIAKTIDPPKADVNPISPKQNFIMLTSLLIGLVIPSILVFVSQLFNTTIRTKEEIMDVTQVPVIGEINHNPNDDNLIVANKGRSAISEQFRALRTNLSFYLKKDNEKIILLTSSMSGEGKSFTAINLGNILALAGKKVLLMELDLRKPGLSIKLGVSNNIGFSNYTIDSDVKLGDIVKPLSINPNMYIISSGPLPPNPAETLLSERTALLIDKLKDQFDYIIMDAPPIGIITDAQLLAPYADVTLYIVRQNITHKRQLQIVEDLSRSNKMKNLGIVVNDIVGRYYGYGYGYGNYGQEVERKKWFTKFFKKG